MNIAEHVLGRERQQRASMGVSVKKPTSCHVFSYLDIWSESYPQIHPLVLAEFRQLTATGGG